MWRKKSTALDETSGIHQLARQLGVERRKNARVLYPKRITGLLPAIRFEAENLHAHDISAGGCCLHDPSERLGKSVGGELILSLQFSDADVSVRSRMVGRVDHRRHIQFLDLAPERAAQIRRVLIPGICGSSLKISMPASTSGPLLAAREVWSSLGGDGLTIEDDIHRAAQAVISGRVVYIFKKAWPSDTKGTPVSRADLLGLILFLANIAHPSAAVSELLEMLENLSLGGPE